MLHEVSLEGRTGETGRWGRICKQLLNDLEKRRSWNLKESTLGCTVWKTFFGRGYGPVARQAMQ